jgi:cyclo(L-tyrosyl-L-tyrosyl) synthase
VKIIYSSINTKNIFEKKEHAVFGISPFNSYFSEKVITDLLYWGLGYFKSINIFLPDTLPIYNFLQLGYSYEKAVYKSKRQANYLKNKINKILSKLNYTKVDMEILLIDMKYLENNNHYNKLKNHCYDVYQNNLYFQDKCLMYINWVFESYKLSNDNKNYQIAVNYFLKELPIFLDTSSILNVSSSTFIYHQTPEIISELFNNKLILSPNQNQGFVQLEFFDKNNYIELE